MCMPFGHASSLVLSFGARVSTVGEPVTAVGEAVGALGVTVGDELGVAVEEAAVRGDVEFNAL